MMRLPRHQRPTPTIRVAPAAIGTLPGGRNASELLSTSPKTENAFMRQSRDIHRYALAGLAGAGALLLLLGGVGSVGLVPGAVGEAVCAGGPRDTLAVGTFLDLPLWLVPFYAYLVILTTSLTTGHRAAGLPHSVMIASAIVTLAFSLAGSYRAFFVWRQLSVMILALVIISSATAWLVTTYRGARRDVDGPARSSRGTMYPRYLTGLTILFVAMSYVGVRIARAWVPIEDARFFERVDPSSAEGRRVLTEWLRSRPRTAALRGAAPGVSRVVMFVDHHCLGCRNVYHQYRALLSAPKANVVYDLLDFPLDSSCNKTIAESVHPRACLAAALFRVARDSARAPELRDWFFQNPRAQPDDMRRAASTIAGVAVDVPAINRAILDIQRDINLARSAKVTSTPAIFVDGVQVPVLPLPLLQAIVELSHEHAVATLHGVP
jgi:hypothetical protein